MGIKKQTIFSLSLTFMASITLAFSALNVSKTSALAENVQGSISAKSLFTAVDSTKLTVSDTEAVLSGAATINGMFNDTATIDYSYDTKNSFRCGYAFTICDEEDNEILAVVRSSKANYQISQYAYYNGTYSWSTDAATVMTSTEKWASYETLPDVYSANVNKLVFTMSDDGIFTIQSGRYESGQPTGIYTFAEFTLTEADATALADGFKIGVRKVDGSKEYDVTPAYGDARDLRIRAINGTVIKNGAVEATVCNENITATGEIVVGGKTLINHGYGMPLNAFTYTAQYTIGSFTGTSSEEVVYDADDFSTKEAGTYDITVTKNGISKNYTVNVRAIQNAGTTALSDLIETDAWDKVITDENGVVFGLEDKTVDFKESVSVHLTFRETATITYQLTHVSAGFAFAVCDTNGNEIATVVRSSIKNHNTSLYAYYNGTYSWSIDGTKTETSTEKWVSCADLPTGVNILGKLKFTLKGNTLLIQTAAVNDNVYNVANFSLTEEHAATLADGFTIGIRTLNSERASDVMDIYSKGLKLRLKAINDVTLGNAEMPYTYTIADAHYNGFIEENTIYVAKNGELSTIQAVAYKKYTTDLIDYTPISTNLFFDGDYDLSVVGTYGIQACHENSADLFGYTLIVEDSYKITFDENGGNELNDIYYSAHTWDVELPTPTRANWNFNSWYMGETPFSRMSADLHADITLTAKWYDDVPPIVYFNDFDSVTHIDDATKFVFAKSDISAVDGANGTLTDDAITIYVKEPNTNQYVEQSAFTFDNELYGFYDIKYVVADLSDNTTTVERKIYYTPAKPVLQVQEEMPKECFVGETITLPTAVGESGDTSLEVSVTVVVDGQQIMLKNNTFKPTAAGEYTVLYLTEDAYGQTASKNFVLQVKADKVKPVITVDFDLDKIELGSELTLPIATATDNVDQTLTVTTQVFKGTEMVSTQSFTPSAMGVYTIYYTCLDSAGNEAVAMFQVTVCEVGSLSNGNDSSSTSSSTPSGGCGCGSNIALGGFGGVLMLVGTILLIKKRKQ